MLSRAWFGVIVIAIAAPVCAQVDTTVAQPVDESPTTTEDRMATPPPVSGETYAAAPTAETRSNYVRGGVTFNSAYSDNVLGGANPTSDVSYSIWPTIALDETTPRLHAVLSYSPGFTFYQRTSSRNEVDQNAGVDVQYRLSPHVTVSFRDTFQESSNVFNQPDQFAAGVSGSGSAPTVAVIAPLAEVLRNTGNGELTYQFSAHGMVGASGTFTNLHYPNPAEVPGLYDSATTGGSAFYNHRLSKKNYLGVTYQYQRILAYPTGTQDETQAHTVSIFYTVYLKPTLSLSLSGGPQHYDAAQPPNPASRAWTPAASASLGWQGQHTSLAASYSRIVTGGGGLTGAFHSNTASASARWQWTRNWNAGLNGAYSIYKTLTPFFFLATPGGHTVSGSASVRRTFGEHMSAEVGYTRLHQSYSEIAAVSSVPDTNREWVSISYQFSRPLGR